MTTKLQKELKQTKPFKSLEEEAILNIARTAEYLASASVLVFKAADLTATQYNVLRILRGAGSEGLSCSDISERMVTKESDITRLLDRIESRGLISRERPASNRRLVIARITDAGLKVLEELDEPVAEINRQLVGHLGKEKLKAVNELMEQIRYKQ
jgi:DNA-binding MarR family transcriptional regulator